MNIFKKRIKFFIEKEILRIMDPIKFTKIRNVKTPTRGTPRSAGIDFYVPEDLTQSELDVKQPVKQEIRALVEGKFGLIKKLELFPNQRILIPSGIKMKIPTGYAGVVMNKSGVSSKTGLDKLAELIDEDYQGEIHINVVNTGTNPVVIRPGDKIAQMIITPVYIADLEMKNSADEVFTEETVRGEGGFGSTNKNDAVEVKVDSVVDAPVAATPAKKRGRPRKQ